MILVVLVLFATLPLQTAAAVGAPADGAALRSHADGSGAWRWQAKLAGAGTGLELECRQGRTCSWLQLRRHCSPPARRRAGTVESQCPSFVPAGCAQRPAAADAEPA